MSNHDPTGAAGAPGSDAAAETDGSATADAPGSTLSSPSEAFQALGAPPRVAVLQRLATGPDPVSFTDLFDATDVATTAGFAYHLRQLDGQYVRKRPVGPDETAYELTDAGRRAAGAIAAGEYTERVTGGQTDLPDPCPYCGDADGLHLTVTDNVTTVACDTCERDCLSVSVPPSGFVSDAGGDVPASVDRYLRTRISTYAAGVCPDCASECAVELHRVEAGDAPSTDRPHPSIGVSVECSCLTCGASAAFPLRLALLEQPAVVAAYHDRGIDVRDRSLWRLLGDWRETVVSTDPWCVSVTLEDPSPGRGTDAVEAEADAVEGEADAVETEADAVDIDVDADDAGDDDEDEDDDDLLGAYVDGDLAVAGVERLDDATDATGTGRITADAPDDPGSEDGTTEDGTPA